MKLRYIVSLCVLFMTSVCLVGWWFSLRRISDRVTVAVATDPVSIWSWDRSRDTYTVVLIPGSFVAAGARGYGNYPIASLWKLGFIDGISGELFAQSLETLLATPVPFYVGAFTDRLQTTDEPIPVGKRAFSPVRIASVLSGSIKSNIPAHIWLSFWWSLSHVRPDAIRVVNLADESVSAQQEEPDGSKRSVLDPTRIDLLLQGAFEDPKVRNEQLSVAVYNTTGIPGLGTYGARLLANAGMFVVSVDNAKQGGDICTIRSQPGLVRSLTISRIQSILGCVLEAHLYPERADVEVYLGQEFAKRFVRVDDK